MNKNDLSEESPLIEALLSLRRAKERNPQAAQRGKEAFLSEAMQFQLDVSRTTSARPNGWKTIFQKERIPMKTIIALLAALGMLFGGTGGVALAAQSAMPGDALYSAKLLTEDIRLSLAPSEEASVDLLLQLADTRTEEMTYLSAGENPQWSEVVGRMLTEVDAAIQIAARADDTTMTRILSQVRSELDVQMRVLTQAQVHASANGVRIMEQTMTMLQERDRFCKAAQENPQALRDQLQQKEQNQTSGQESTPAPAQTPERDQTRAPDQTQDQTQSQDRTGQPEGITGGSQQTLNPENTGLQATQEAKNSGLESTCTPGGNGFRSTPSATQKYANKGSGGSGH
jgi:hypothetical protein